MYCSHCGSQVPDNAQFCSACGQSQSPSATPTAPVSYAPPIASVPTGYSYAPMATQTAYAGFWLRFVAYIIDGLILAVCAMPIVLLLGGMTVMQGMISGEHPDEMAPAMISAIFFWELAAIGGVWLYYALFECSSWQATPGKKALGLYVTDMNGQRISFGRATGRYFAKIISGMTLLIGYVMAGFTARKQALHDLIAGTLVLRKL